jgi:hypothetical protein
MALMKDKEAMVNIGEDCEDCRHVLLPFGSRKIGWRRTEPVLTTSRFISGKASARLKAAQFSKPLT